MSLTAPLSAYISLKYFFKVFVSMFYLMKKSFVKIFFVFTLELKAIAMP